MDFYQLIYSFDSSAFIRLFARGSEMLNINALHLTTYELTSRLQDISASNYLIEAARNQTEFRVSVVRRMSEIKKETPKIILYGDPEYCKSHDLGDVYIIDNVRVSPLEVLRTVARRP